MTSTASTAVSGGAADRDRLISRIAGALRTDDATALAAISRADYRRPAEGSARPGVTSGVHQRRPGSLPADQQRYRRGPRRAYADIPDGDLATAARVLTLITARLNAA